MPKKEKRFTWQKLKKFLKRNMTVTWAKHFSYQVFAFLVSVAMVVGVASYAFEKSYDERTLRFVDGFTITAHSGAYNTADNTLEYVRTALEKNTDIIEIDVRQRPNGTIVMGHDIIVTNSDGVEVASVFELVKDRDVLVNLDIKETKLLSDLHKMITEYNLAGKVFLTGIEQHQVKAVKDKCPGVDYYINCVPSRFKIFSEDYQQKIIGMLEETGAIGINCNFSYASTTLSDVLHRNGYKLSVWTVDKKRQMKRALVIKPDNITTHYPDELHNLIDNWGK